ncbi:CBS domain-containing protein [bacterium]|nr:CBS domain-containing protein [bacterium]
MKSISLQWRALGAMLSERFRFKNGSDVQGGEYRTNMLLALIIGIAGGYGAVFFRGAISFVTRLGYGATMLTVDYLESLPWWMRLTIPVAGGLIVGPIVTKFASEAKGHGVPEVMAAVAVRGGIIRPRVAAAKVVASAVCIGSGGSAGQEGPIVQIGSSIASALGQVFKVSPRRLKTFVGCGAAAGIAATFNAPIGGMLFALEIIIGEFGIAQLSPIIVASVVATAISHMHLGDHPAFAVPEYHLQSPFELIHYAMLGVAAAAVGVMFILSLHSSEDFFNKLKIPAWIKPAIGGLIVGTLGAVGLPHIHGVGYDFIEQALLGEAPLMMLVILVFAKIAATSATLGSGGSGGIFAPSLFMGAMLGGVVWYGAHYLTPDLVSPNYGPYALVGMAAMVASTTRAPLQAIILLFELTGGYAVILPLMLSSVIGVLIGNRLFGESIYTIKLKSKGILLRRGREINVLRGIFVKDVMRTELHTVPDNMRLRPLIDFISADTRHTSVFVLDSEQKLKGAISFHELRRVLFDIEALEPVLVADDIANYDVAHVKPADTLDVVMRLFARQDMDELPVVDPDDTRKLIGTIHRADVADAYHKEVLNRDLVGTVATSFSMLDKVSHAGLAPGYSMAEIEVPAHYVGKDLRRLDLRNKDGLEVLLVRRHTPGSGSGMEGMVPSADIVLQAGDVLLVSGKKEAVERLAHR